MTQASASIALNAANQLCSQSGMVPVYHKMGKCTNWIDNGRGGQQLDPNSVQHEFWVELKKFTIRQGGNAGGEIQHCVYPSSDGSFIIVRLENDRLVMGDRHLPNWMY